MKPLKERIGWKILLGLIAFIAVGTVVIYIICQASERHTISVRQKEYQQAKEAGYDEELFICSREETVTLDGVEYIRYNVFHNSFLDSSREDVLIRTDAVYKDDTDGKLQDLVIYGKTTGFADDIKSEVKYYPGQYRVIEPYRIAIYKKAVDMWAVVGLAVLAGMVDIALALILAVYLIVYFVKKKKTNKK